MKTTTITASLLAGLSLFLASCASTSTTASNSSSASGVKPYKLTTCIVTDNDLGSMGDEKTFVYQGQEIKFCCQACEGKFLKNPAKYLAKLK